MAVERDVGGVQIEHDLGRRLGLRLDKQIREQPVDLLRGVVDLGVVLAAAGKLQPVQRALARQRLVQLAPAAEQRQQRVCAQLLVVVQIFVAQR